MNGTEYDGVDRDNDKGRPDDEIGTAPDRGLDLQPRIGEKRQLRWRQSDR